MGRFLYAIKALLTMRHRIATSPVTMSHRGPCFLQSFLVWIVSWHSLLPMFSNGPSAVHGSLVSLRVVRGDARAPRALAPLTFQKLFMLSLCMWSAVSAQSHGGCMDLPSYLRDLRWPNPALCRSHDFAGEPGSFSPFSQEAPLAA